MRLSLLATLTVAGQSMAAVMPPTLLPTPVKARQSNESEPALVESLIAAGCNPFQCLSIVGAIPCIIQGVVNGNIPEISSSTCYYSTCTAYTKSLSLDRKDESVSNLLAKSM
ncbi:hypothetical protein N657DRAFT_636320 [Parathielavia appendiculata]|uniref:Hydrophobin n=1 Tax=Parathielavia appendiculata TaxID=2587402 RepID=A0AAN6TTX1_9PEZI|nr:hypothetical protein N657DRAFT_636320 [Parathielavia appendiculata]